MTTKADNNNDLNYLDVTIMKNNKHKFKIYGKSTQTEHSIDSNSNHLVNHKLATWIVLCIEH